MRAGIMSAAAILAACIFGALTAFGANQKDYDDCNQEVDRDRRLSGCSGVINDRRVSQQIRAFALNKRGTAYKEKGDLDRAIADYNEAIRHAPKEAIHYASRGGAYFAKDELDRSIADFNEAIQLNPKYEVAYNNRGNLWLAKGELDRAIADFTQTIHLKPRLPLPYLNRAIAQLYSEFLDKALADLDQSSALDPKDGFAALWLDIVSERSNLNSRLTEATTQLDMTKWPAPIVRLFLGQMTPEAVFIVAEDPATGNQKEQVCETNFFIGQLMLQRGTYDKAIEAFRLAASGCPKTLQQWWTANAELKARRANP